MLSRLPLALAAAAFLGLAAPAPAKTAYPSVSYMYPLTDEPLPPAADELLENPQPAKADKKAAAKAAKADKEAKRKALLEAARAERLAKKKFGKGSRAEDEAAALFAAQPEERSFFGRVWDSISDFFSRLWRSISDFFKRLFSRSETSGANKGFAAQAGPLRLADRLKGNWTWVGEDGARLKVQFDGAQGIFVSDAEEPTIVNYSVVKEQAGSRSITLKTSDGAVSTYQFNRDFSRLTWVSAKLSDPNSQRPLTLNPGWVFKRAGRPSAPADGLSRAAKPPYRAPKLEEQAKPSLWSRLTRPFRKLGGRGKHCMDGRVYRERWIGYGLEFEGGRASFAGEAREYTCGEHGTVVIGDIVLQEKGDTLFVVPDHEGPRHGDDFLEFRRER